MTRHEIEQMLRAHAEYQADAIGKSVWTVGVRLCVAWWGMAVCAFVFLWAWNQ